MTDKPFNYAGVVAHGRVIVFDSFQRDTRLPKFQQPEGLDPQNGESVVVGNRRIAWSTNDGRRFGIPLPADWVEMPEEGSDEGPIFQRHTGELIPSIAEKTRTLAVVNGRTQIADIDYTHSLPTITTLSAWSRFLMSCLSG